MPPQIEENAMSNKTGKTTDIESIVNSAVMAVDEIMRKNDVPFSIRHVEARELLMPIIASAVADHQAALAKETLDRILSKTEAA
jgi:hypothetical protein